MEIDYVTVTIVYKRLLFCLSNRTTERRLSSLFFTSLLPSGSSHESCLYKKIRLTVCPCCYMEKVLEQVRDFADRAHGNQLRKYTPERYIVHPVRVMEMCHLYGASLPVKAAALLHDVLEDTAVTEKELYQFLSTVMSEAEAKQTLSLVIELTDVYTKEKYARWNRRKRKRKEAERIEKTSAESQTIKYADIIDNCREIVTADPEFAGTFLRECQMLLHKMPKGNIDLYKEAMATVTDCLQRVPKAFKFYR